MFPYEQDVDDNIFAEYKDITKNQSESYSYFDMSYAQRVQYLRAFSQQNTIRFVLDTIADEAIVPDENNYFAQLDLDLLKSNLSADSKDTEKLIETCQKAFKKVYSMYGWDKSNSAWNMFKKFLIEGYLAFEIIYDGTLDSAQNIIGFKFLDSATLEPGIQIGSDGRELKVWYQNHGDAQERIIPDSNIVYIAWPSGLVGESQCVSYLEGLTRSYNMLTQIENSRLIWNIQNAQKKMKIVVPVNDLAPYKADALMNQLKAEWNEETYVDGISGEMVVNGVPKFSFTKTYFFPQRNSGSLTLEEIAAEGYDLSSIEPMKYWWRRFILESQIPPNRYLLDPSADSAHTIGGDDSSITREEYAFSRFINRIRNIYREVLLKPLWIQICLWEPALQKSEYLRQALGIKFNEENAFVEAKQRQALKSGVDIINTLYGLQDANGQPIFSMKFLVERYLDMSPEDMELNEKYKQQEILEKIETAKRMKQHAEYNQQHQQQPVQAPGNEGGDFGGGGGGDFGADFGGGGGDDFMSTGGGDFGGGDMGGGAEEPAADTGGGGEDFA